jgi:hypothetical protein
MKAKVSPTQFINFQNKRKILNLCKGFLMLLEDEEVQGCVDGEKYKKIRKRVLDYGNDAIRELDEHLDNFKVDFK